MVRHESPKEIPKPQPRRIKKGRLKKNKEYWYINRDKLTSSKRELNLFLLVSIAYSTVSLIKFVTFVNIGRKKV